MTALERISDMTIAHYQDQSRWYQDQTSGLGALLADVVLALEVPPMVTPEPHEPVLMGCWPRSAILARIAELKRVP